MTQYLARLVAWTCLVLIALQVGLVVSAFIDLGAFAQLTQRELPLPIQWGTVQRGQWLALLVLTIVTHLPGLAALYVLRRPFANFAHGEFFTRSNSQDLRRFAVLLLVQALLRPVHLALASIFLSLNHPPGQKVLSVSVGSGELQTVGLALVFWVLASLLVEGARLQGENRQFV